MEWQPIETAPKDDLILATDGNDHWVVWWSDETRWTYAFDAIGRPISPIGHIKYWMPLPELSK